MCLQLPVHPKTLCSLFNAVPFTSFNVFLTLSSGEFPWQLAEFVIGVFLQVLGLPFVAVAQVSLFSKVTAEKTQGGLKGASQTSLPAQKLHTVHGPLSD